MRNNQPVTGHEVFMRDDMIIVSKTDEKGKIQFVNKDFLDISGFKADELIGQPHNIIRHPDMPTEAFEDLWRDLKAGLPWSGYVKNRVKNGDHYWVHANATPVVENGRTTGYISIRSKPDAATTRVVDDIYRQFRAGKADGMSIEHGRVMKHGFKDRMHRYFERFDNKIIAVILALCTIILIIGGMGFYFSGHVVDSPSSIGVWLNSGIIVAGLIGAFFASRYLRRTLDKRLSYLDRCLNSIAGGNFTTDISVNDDELQNILVTIKALQAKLAYNELEKKELERQKKESQIELANRFENEVGAVVNGISTAATELQSTAESMGATAEETSRQSTAVAAASEQATANVQTVSAATEELASSVKEIENQIAQSTLRISEAVQQANAANDRVRSLSEAAQKIGSVIDIIHQIAGQTNLLALNATIEAARAGESGKGFAVVASEVKHLAGQTAKATEEISQQVGHIQEETRNSVEAIQKIAGKISEVNKIAQTIEASVAQQGGATSEIAKNVTEAAMGTQEVTSNMVGVSKAAGDTGAAATQVLSAASEVAKYGELLRSKVRDFLDGVRNA